MQLNTRIAHYNRGYVAAGLAGLVVLAALVGLASTRGLSQTGPQPQLSHFVPTEEQLRGFAVQKVALRTFRTEIVTDGYVAAGGQSGAAGSLPVLPGQASDTLQAENDLAAARVQYRNAAAAEDRQHKLYLSEGAALKDWQQSQADLATAAAAVASARSRLRLLGKSDADSGGAFVVGDGSSVWLIANVREADAGLVRIGDPLSAQIAALPGQILSGRVSFVSAVIDPTTHRLAIGARIANPGGQLKPNMAGILTILGGDIRQSPAVPQNTIVYDGDQAHVWVVGPTRELSMRQVTPGRSRDGFVEILGGLQVGERIATTGALFIDQAVNAN